MRIELSAYNEQQLGYLIDAMTKLAAAIEKLTKKLPEVPYLNGPG